MIILEHEQRTEAWQQAKIGVPSASEFNKIITSTGKPSTQRNKYMLELAGERLGGIIEETYQSFAMIRGTELEGEARKLYELAHEPVQQTGFCLSDCKRYGFSPDGLIGVDGGLEIKCPTIGVHVSYMIENDVPTDYYCQVQGALLVSGRKWWDFWSYYPGLNPVHVREAPDENFQILLKKELESFCQELDETVKKLS